MHKSSLVLFFIYFCVYESTCREVIAELLNVFPPLSFSMVFFFSWRGLSPNTVNFAQFLVSKPLRSACFSFLQCWSYRRWTRHPVFQIRSSGSEGSSHTESFLQPLFLRVNLLCVFVCNTTFIMCKFITDSYSDTSFIGRKSFVIIRGCQYFFIF